MAPLDNRLDDLITILHSHADEAAAVAIHLRRLGGRAMAANLLDEMADIARTLHRLRSVTSMELDTVVGGRSFLDTTPVGRTL